MDLLHIIGTLDPTYGGPVEGLRQLAQPMITLGHRSEVITLDGPNVPWDSHFPMKVHALGPSVLKYRYTPKLLSWLRLYARNYDAVIVHGIWQYQSLATWRALRNGDVPYFVFIHGALNPWLKRTFPMKQLKKWLYWPWAEYRVLRDACAVLFTCEEERILAKKSFWLYRCTEAVVGLGVSIPDGKPEDQEAQFLSTYPHLTDKKILLFLGRIHPIKGCDLLIKAFAQVLGGNKDWHLVIAGPEQDGLQRDLMTLSKRFDISDQITWTGMLTGEKKWGAYYAAEAFILPSHSENFGVTVAESLACGLPVLISDKVNVWREIRKDAGGIVAPDTLEGTMNSLRTWMGLADDEKARIREKSKNCFLRHFEAKKAATTLLDIVEEHICFSRR